jgi:hypothetical protein
MSGKKSSSTVTTTSSSASKLHYNDLSYGSGNHEIRIPKPSVAFDHYSDTEHGTNNKVNTSYHSEHDASDYEDYTARRGFQSYLSNQQNESANQHQSTPHSTNFASTPASTGSERSHTKTGPDLQHLISSLEDEFDSLNRQYRLLLSNVNAESDVVPASTATESIQAQAEEIVSVIQKLHHKGEQLRILKSPSKNKIFSF